MKIQKTEEEILRDALQFLEDANFSYACFTDNFKRYVEKVIKKDGGDKST